MELNRDHVDLLTEILNLQGQKGDTMIKKKEYKLWFCTGSQDLYYVDKPNKKS